MTRLLLIAMLLVTMSVARENPFFSAEGTKALPVSTNKIKVMEPLQRAAINLPGSARVIKQVTVEYQNLDGSLAKKSISLDQSVDWHLPIFISQTFTTDERPAQKRDAYSAKDFALVADFDVISFYQSGNDLRIVTKDEMMRHFMLIDPHRIAIDYRHDGSFSTVSKKIDAKPFKKVRLGNHDGYYRVVIMLDGQYKYKIKEEMNGQLLSCY